MKQMISIDYEILGNVVVIRPPTDIDTVCSVSFQETLRSLANKGSCPSPSRSTWTKTLPSIRHWKRRLRSTNRSKLGEKSFLKKNNVILALLIVFLVPVCVRAFAPQAGPRDFKFERQIITVPGEEIMDTWTSFQRWSRGVWTVRWNPRTGVPLSILGAGNIRNRDRDPVKIARTFLRETSSFFRFRDELEDLVLKRVISSGGSQSSAYEKSH